MDPIENTSENTNVETSKNIRKFIYVDTNCNFPPIIYQVRFKIKMIELLGENGKYSYDELSIDEYKDLLDEPIAFAAFVVYDYDPDFDYKLNIEEGDLIRNGYDSEDSDSEDSDDDLVLTKKRMDEIYDKDLNEEILGCIFSFVYAETDLTLQIDDAKEKFKKKMVDIFGEYDNKHNFRYLSEGDYENPNDKSILFAARVFYVCHSGFHYNGDDCVLNEYDNFNNYKADKVGYDHLIEFAEYYFPLTLHYAEATNC